MDNASHGKKQRVLVIVILDKSGSMAAKASDVIEGFNAYLAGLAEEDSVDYSLSLTLFDTEIQYRHVGVPLSKIDKLDFKSYRPGGNTALNDAIGMTVRKVEADGHQADKVVTVIMTDGEENSSREWSTAGVKALVQEKEKNGDWTFVFMGAAIDAWSQGASYGIRESNVAQYDTRQHVATFQALSLGTNHISSLPKAGSKNIFESVSKTILQKVGLHQPGGKS